LGDLDVVSKVAEKVPGWVGRFLIPEIERVVEKEVESLRREMNARFEAIDTKFESIDARFDAIDTRFEAVNARLDGIEKRFDLVQDVAVLKAEMKEIQEKMS
jgi:tetrahydromethanopterin S-methyltransferase subunit G